MYAAPQPEKSSAGVTNKYIADRAIQSVYCNAIWPSELELLHSYKDVL